ncbi:transposase [Rhodococcus wratislaviensis]|uniref:transposase n=1 Tax=Rhodococcus wratislaviensis TaxID=44752 RepID=UPI003651B64C
MRVLTHHNRRKGGRQRDRARLRHTPEATWHRWQREYGGIETHDAKRFDALQKENARLKTMVADQALDRGT